MYDKVAEDIYYATMEKLAVSNTKRFGAAFNRLYNSVKNNSILKGNEKYTRDWAKGIDNGGSIKTPLNVGKFTKKVQSLPHDLYNWSSMFTNNDQAALQALYHLDGLFGNKLGDKGIYNAMKGLGFW